MSATFLDELPFVDAVTAWGAVGLHGDHGYDVGRVRVRNTPYLHAISAHAPSRVRVRLDGGYTTFRCHVALNDDVRSGASCADFRVISDGRLVAAAQRVVAGGLPIELTADVNDVAVLELRSETDRPTYCHSVWIDPFLSTESTRVSDPLDRVEFDNSRARIRAPRCVATVVTPNFVNLLDEMLASLRMSNPSTDIAVVVLAVDPDRACYEVAERHGIHPSSPRSTRSLASLMLKASCASTPTRSSSATSHPSSPRSRRAQGGRSSRAPIRIAIPSTISVVR